MYIFVKNSKYAYMITTDHFHPMLVHFPIALVTVGFLADLISLIVKKEICFTKMSFFLLLLGTLAAMAAVFTGEFFTSEMAGAAGNVRESHALLAFTTLGLLVVTSVFRIVLLRKPENAPLKWAAFVLYAVSVVCVSVTGALGGTLVYNFMMPL